MNRRISVLVAVGYALLLGLGVVACVIMLVGLSESEKLAERSRTWAIEVRASVRSLRADYLADADALAQLLIDPTRELGGRADAQADADAASHLTAALAATGRPALHDILLRLYEHDLGATADVESRVRMLARRDVDEARRLYLDEYVPARDRNLELVDRALSVASDEVAEAEANAAAEARTTRDLAWATLAWFVVAGIAGGAAIVHTVRKLAGHADRVAAELEAARDAALDGSRAKSEFLANVSHEIRTPMNVIIGYTDMLLETGLSETQHDCLERVRVSTVALLRLMNDILDLSKVEAGKLTLESLAFDPRAVVDEVVRTLGLRAAEKGLALSVDVAPDVPPTVLGDPTRLRQVVLNLLSNAVKFTDTGHVAVRVTRERDGAGGPASLHVAVADTGIGISPDRRAVIFDAFTQADGSMTRRYGGTGLGLAIAAQLVRLMKGRIWVESEVGVGSTFHVTLPLAGAASATLAA